MEQAEFTPFLYAELAPIFYKYTKINVKLYSFSS